MGADKLKDGALQVFAEKGYEGTSIKDITKRLNMTAPALYAHYDSKEDLYLTIFQECIEDLKETVMAAVRKRPEEYSLEMLHDIYLAQLEFFSAKPMQGRLILSNAFFPPSELKEKLAAIIDESLTEFRESVCRIFSQLMQAGIIEQKPLEVYIRYYFKLINGGTLEVTVFHSPLDREEFDLEWGLFIARIKR